MDPVLAAWIVGVAAVGCYAGLGLIFLHFEGVTHRRRWQNFVKTVDGELR